MDRKSLTILLLSAALMMLWFALVNKIWPPKPRPASTNLTSVAAPQTVPAITNLVPSAPNPPPEPVEAPSPEELLTLETAKARYTLSSHGGGLKQVEFIAKKKDGTPQYPEVVTCQRKASQVSPLPASVNAKGPLPTLAMLAPGVWRGDDQFQLSKTATNLVAEKLYPNGLRVTKQFQPTSNYLVRALIRLENTTTQALTLPAHELTIGTAAPNDPQEDPQNLGIYWHAGKKTDHIDQGWFANRTLGCLPGTPRTVFVGGAGDAGWGAVHNQFFTVALVPAEPAQQILARPLTVAPARKTTEPAAEPAASAQSPWLFSTNDFASSGAFATKLRSPPTVLAKYVADHLSPESRRDLEAFPGGRSYAPLDRLVADLNRLVQERDIYQDNRAFFAQGDLRSELRHLAEEQPQGENRTRLNRLLLEQLFARELVQSPGGYLASLSYAPQLLAPSQALEKQFHIYAGPREYNTLARIGGQMQNQLDRIMGYDGFFGMFAKGLLLSMNALHATGLGYAMAIIAITIIIKLLFWPLTNASTKSMKRMATLQPQMKALQDKYKDDPAKMNRKLMEFMKEHKVSPLGGCLPMLLQLPVFFGFFLMIRSAIELRGARFLWVCDLSKPDTLFHLPGLGWPFNLLPLIMGVTMLYQARLTPPSPGMDPVQQKIMKYMPLMFLVFLYNFSSGLTLYWTVQNLLSIAQMKLTKAKPETTSAQAKGPVAKNKPRN